MKETSFEETSNCVPQPYNDYEDLDLSPYELPLVLVPPEAIELGEGEEEDVQVRKEEWPEYFIRVFPNDVSIVLLLHSYLIFKLKRSHPTTQLPPDMLFGHAY